MSVKTNIKFKMLIPSGYVEGEKSWDDITDDVKKNPIVILDNIPGIDHYGEFNNYYVEDSLIPLHITASWGLGGGGPTEINQVVSFFTNPNSPLYLPTILINLALTPVYNKVISTITGLIEKMKQENKTKRPRIAFYDKKGKITNYEFSSFASIKDIEKGLKDIPNYAQKANNKDYFARDIKNNKWIKES